MAVSCQTVISLVEKFAPKRLACEWDNIGLQIGHPACQVERVFLSLDLNDEVLEEAVANRADMLIVHHTPFFKPLKNLRSDLPGGKLITEIIRNNMVLYTAHTNLDATWGGVSDVLARMLNLQDIRTLSDSWPIVPVEKLVGVAYDVYPLINEGKIAGLGRVGRLSNATTLAEFIAVVKEKLAVCALRYCGDLNKPVEKVAVCGGSGADFIAQAVFAGADVFLTADVKYHEAQEALAANLALVDAGHFATEQPIIPVLADFLRTELGEKEVEIAVSIISTDPFCFDKG